MSAFFSTNRRWIVGLLLSLILSVAVYALAGFFLVPYLVQTQVWPLLSEKTGGHFQAERLKFNPFALSLEMGGFALKGPDQAELVSIGELNVDVDAWASIKSKSLVAQGKVTRPSIAIHVDQQGKPNFAFLLIKEEKPKEAKAPLIIPFLLTHFDIVQGRLAFEDQSRGAGFKTVMDPLDFSVENLGIGAESAARFKFYAKQDGKELISTDGDLHLEQTVINGELQLQDIPLAPLAAWLVSEKGYAVGGGLLTVKLKYRYGKESDFEIPFLETVIKEFSLSKDGQPFLAVGWFSVQDSSYQLKTNQFQLKSLGLEKIALNGPATMAVASLKAQGLGFDLKANQLKLDSIAVDGIGLEAPVSVAVDSINTQGLHYDLQGKQLQLQSMSVERIGLNAPFPVDVGSVKAQGLVFDAKANQLKLQSTAVDKIDLKTPTPVSDENGKPRYCGVGGLSVGQIALNLADKTLQIDKVATQKSSLAAWLQRDGSLGVPGFPAADPPHALAVPEKPSANESPGSPWKVVVDKLELDNNDIALRDFTTDPPVAMRLSPLNLQVKNFSTESGKPFWLGLNTGLSMNGRIALEGKINLSPTTANLKVYIDDLSLPAFQAYLDKAVRFRVLKGTLNLNADIDFENDEQPQFRFGGDIAVADFASDDRRKGKDFINFNNLRLNGIVFDNSPQKISIREVIASEPYVRAVLYSDKKFNIAENLSPPSPATVAQDGKAVELKPKVPTPHHGGGLGWGLDKSEATPPFDPNTAEIRHPLPPREGRVRAKKPAILTNLPKLAEPVTLTPTGSAPLASLSPKGEGLNSTTLPFEPPPQDNHTVQTIRTDKGGKAGAPMTVVIGVVHINDADADFTDMTIKPTNFSVSIHNLNGNIRSLSSHEESKSDVMLLGKLDEGAPAKIFGKINLFSVKLFTDITMDFNDVNLTTLSPYSSKFAGYRIEKGKMSMNLHYLLENGQLTAQNNFVLDQLTLGERVDSPEATSLPVSLAISLLKDSNGQIKLDLPVSGDLNNPQIDIWGLLGNAATTLLTKLVAAPFNLIAGLVSSGSEEDLGAVKFSPGMSELSVQEKGELSELAKALQERPALDLEIKATAHPVLDRPALAEQGLSRQLKNTKLIELGNTKNQQSASDELTLNEDDYARLLTNLYRSQNPDSPELQDVKINHALTGDLLQNAKRKLLDKWVVSDADLRRLAQARAKSIRDYLMQSSGISDQRIYLLDVKLLDKDDKEIKSLLSLNSH